MKRGKTKKYELKILKGKPFEEEVFIVELTELDDDNDSCDSEHELIEKLAEEFRENSKYDEPF
jgi:hypothetical protein